jgi:hypothetical protein
VRRLRVFGFEPGKGERRDCRRYEECLDDHAREAFATEARGRRAQVRCPATCQGFAAPTRDDRWAQVHAAPRGNWPETIDDESFDQEAPRLPGNRGTIKVFVNGELLFDGPATYTPQELERDVAIKFPFASKGECSFSLTFDTKATKAA